MNEKSLIPSLRFVGFTDAWERRKLGELGKARSGIGFPDAEQGGTDGLPFFKVSDMNISGNEHEMTKSQNYVSIEQIQRKKWTPILEVPAMFFAKVGAAVLLNRKRLCRTPFLLDNNTMAYSVCGEKWNVDFAKALFDTVYLPSLIQVGALPSYNARDVESLEITLPNMEEQSQIGHFFRSLDCLITLHQRKHEKLLNIKKSMLEKMFPKNGELFPEVRFAGYTDAWERRKLGEISSLITKGTTPLDKSNTGNVNFVKIENIDNDTGIISITHRISQHEHESYLHRSQLRENDILFSIAGTLGRVTSVSSTILPANTNQALAIVRLKAGNLDYIKTFLKGKAVSDFVRKNPTIGAQPNLSLEQVANLGICRPNENEQEVIGTFFKKLNHLITLHQRKLEKLQNIKKACLEKMFV